MSFHPGKKNGLPIRGKQFEEIRTINTRRNSFNLSYDNRGSYNQGWLYPILCKTVCPGDTWNISLSALLRARPLKVPMFQRVNVHFEAWFVPNRIIWTNWEKFRTVGGGSVSMEQQPDFVPPEAPWLTMRKILSTEWLTSAGTPVNKMAFYQSTIVSHTVETVERDLQLRLADQLGLPSPIRYGDHQQPHLSDLTPYPWFGEDESGYSYPWDRKLLAYRHRAYYKIWYEFYRDQNNYSSPEPVATDGELDDDELYTISALLPRAYGHDYFTSALYSPQRGMPVSFSLATGVQTGIPFDRMRFNDGSAGASVYNMQYANTPGSPIQYGLTAGTSTPAIKMESGTIDLDFSSVGAITIEQLRQAERLQEWQEVQARCGTRYSEFLRGHFDVISSDARLQRPEYIAGGVMPLTISDVMSQAQTNSTNGELGNYAGKITGARGGLDKFSYYAEEDGQLMVLMSILPDTSYSQGIPFDFTMFDPLDYMNPRFAQLGEQPVYLEELYANDETAINEEDGERPIFGYQSRYQNYRYSPDEIHGQMRGTELSWTLSRLFHPEDFDTFEYPELGFDFVSANKYQFAALIDVPGQVQRPARTERDFGQYRSFYNTSSTTDHFYGDIWIDAIGERKLPEYNVPTL